MDDAVFESPHINEAAPFPITDAKAIPILFYNVLIYTIIIVGGLLSAALLCAFCWLVIEGLMFLF